MRKLAITAVLVLAAAACGDSGGTTTGITAGPPLTLPPDSATTTTAPPVGTTAGETTLAPTSSTTTTAPPTTTTTSPGAGEFAITQVIFGENGYVAITNVGAAAADLDGHWLCQRPNYLALPSVMLEPGQFVWIATGDGAALDAASAGAVAVSPANGGLGRFGAGGGEIALYEGSSFSDEEAIRGYVEWGPEGALPRAGRGAVAALAGVWRGGEVVAVSRDAIGITATAVPAVGAGDWVGDLGG